MVGPPEKKRRRVVESQESPLELPGDVLFEILLRFAVEDLQSICRNCPSVLSIVRDPYFGASQSTSVLFSSPTLTRQLEYANGLLCSGSGHVTTLFNPTVGASRTFPPFFVDQATVNTYLGFDVSIGKFKVLGISKRANSDGWGDPHIYTLEDARATLWRPLVCSISHALFRESCDSKSISINGLLFYVARLPDKKSTTLIHLDLTSESFASNTFPELVVC
ncbi:unnamed protein product [Brassica oleracea var. botrytis]